MLAMTGFLLMNSRPGDGSPSLAKPSNEAKIAQSFSNLPLSFEEHRGQANSDARFVSRGPGYTLCLTPSESRFALRDRQSSFGLKLIDSSPDPTVEGVEVLPGKSNYFIGNDPSQWRTDVVNYSRVRYRAVYPGVDLIYDGQQGRLEYDFVVAPRTDPKQIRFDLADAGQIKIDELGNLVFAAGEATLRLRKPTIYQVIEDRRQVVEGGYHIDQESQISFEIGNYDSNKELIIDPVVEYSTYFGGSGSDIGYAIAIDSQNNIYITGQTSSGNLPLKNPYDNTLEGANDAFVMKLNSAGTTLLFSTYIGGRNPGDRGWGIAVDRSGNVYFTGETNSLNFPVVNAAQPNFRGNVDAFAAKLNVSGNVLLYSTYLGGTLFDSAYAIALDQFDSAYIVGRTDSTSFPVKNALQPALRGQRDAFVTKLDADGALVFSTFLGGEPAVAGGRDDEAGYGVAIDSLQNIYLTGFTSSPSFPIVNGLQPTFGGVEDAFIAKLNASGSAIVYSTFLGGTRVDNGRGIAVDSFGDVCVTGYTISSDFPVLNALQPEYGGNTDAFVAKLNASGKAFIYSTYIGGSGEENTGLVSDNVPTGAIAVDNLGNVYLTGKTESIDFPLVRPVQPALRGDNDAFILKLDPAGSALIYSTYLGSSFTGNTGFDERGLGLAIDPFGTVFVTGQVLKNDLMTVFPVQANYGGGLSDAFIAKISTPEIITPAPVSAASYLGAAHATESIVAVFGANLAGGTEIANTVPLPTTLLGATVKVKDKSGVERSAPLFFVSPGQVNFQIPPGVAPGKAAITMTNTQGTTNTSTSATIWVGAVAPGIFTANNDGQGVPAALLLRVKADGSQIYEPVARLDEFGRFVPAPIDLGPETDQVFLILFGTGWRGRSDLSKVQVQVGGIAAPVLFAGPQGVFIGEDQINMSLPRSLAGKGEVALTMTVDGMIANAVKVNLR